MSEKPILFSGEMVRAIMAGKKTQTRRIYKGTKAPYRVGDLLYVRETWYLDIIIGGKRVYQYKADYPDGCVPFDWSAFDNWSPSIHMPKDAARIWLNVTDIRLRSLKDITRAEAIKEGLCSKKEFRALWEQLYGAGSWDSNPFVWVIEFEMVRRGEEK